VKLLPELRLEPENMILTRRFAVKKPPDDGRLGFPIRQRSGDQLLLSVLYRQGSLRLRCRKA
jgi:hypothetical protein